MTGEERRNGVVEIILDSFREHAENTITLPDHARSVHERVAPRRELFSAINAVQTAPAESNGPPELRKVSLLRYFAPIARSK